MQPMSPDVLIRSRHSLHMERLKEYNRRFNAGEERTGLTDTITLIEGEKEVVLELEHLAEALGITLDERLYGG